MSQRRTVFRLIPIRLRDSTLRHPLFMELDHLLIASQAVLLIGRWEVFRRLRTPSGSCLPTRSESVLRGRLRPDACVKRRDDEPGGPLKLLQDFCGMGGQRGTALLLPFFDPLPPNRTCIFQCIRLSSVISSVRLTQAFVSSVFHRSHHGGMWHTTPVFCVSVPP